MLREKHHTDLMVQTPGQQTLVIENKVFALPDTEQLDRIAAILKADAPRLVLLSLTDPGWVDNTWTTPEGLMWTWLSYGQLADRLRLVVPAVADADDYAGTTLTVWLKLTRKRSLAWARQRSPAG